MTVVLWDVDGTLLRARGAGAQCFRDGLATMGRPWPDGPFDFGGRTDREIAALLLAATRAADATGAADEWADATTLLGLVEAAYASRAAELAAMTSALPNVHAAIAALAAAGILQTVVTGNLRSIARHKLAAVGLLDALRLDLGAFGDDHLERAELIARALERVEGSGLTTCTSETCWVVGDTPRDLAAARVAGVRCALVATGTHHAEALGALEPDLVLADLHDVDTLLAAVTPEV